MFSLNTSAKKSLCLNCGHRRWRQMLPIYQTERVHESSVRSVISFSLENQKWRRINRSRFLHPKTEYISCLPFFFLFFLTWRSVISQPFAVFLQPWVQKKLLGRSLKCKYEQNAIVLNETVYRGVFLSAYGNILYPVMCITKCWASSHPCLWRTEPFRGYRSWCCHLLPVNLLTCWMFQTGYYRAFHNFPCLLLIPPQLAGIKFRINKYIYKS